MVSDGFKWFQVVSSAKTSLVPIATIVSSDFEFKLTNDNIIRLVASKVTRNQFAYSSMFYCGLTKRKLEGQIFVRNFPTYVYTRGLLYLTETFLFCYL